MHDGEFPEGQHEHRRQFFLQLLNQAQVRLPGASIAGLKAELFDTLREFFTDSLAWQEAIPLTVVQNTTSYEIIPNGEGIIIALVNVIDQNKIAQPAIMNELGTVTFQFPYQQTQQMTVQVAKSVGRPFENRGVPHFPTWVLTKWGNVILDGLLGRMMAHPLKGYTNDAKSLYHLRRFRVGIAMARTATLHGNTVGAQTWRYPGQWRTRNQKGGVTAGNPNQFQ